MLMLTAITIVIKLLFFYRVCVRDVKRTFGILPDLMKAKPEVTIMSLEIQIYVLCTRKHRYIYLFI